MWIVNQDGYFSVVMKDGNPDRPMCVRSQVRKDLERLCKRIGIERQIAKGVATDYEYRLWLSRKELSQYQADIVADLTYTNFKASLKTASPMRLDVYMNIWSASFGLNRVDTEERFPHHKPTTFGSLLRS